MTAKEGYGRADTCIAIVIRSIQGSAKRRTPGLVNFVIAVAYHSCLALPAAFTQPEDSLLAEPCTEISLSRCSRLRECYRHVEAEVVSKSRNKIHTTWGPLFSPPSSSDYYSALGDVCGFLYDPIHEIKGP